MTGKLNLDPQIIAQARSAAMQIAIRVQVEIEKYTTTAVERTTARLFGIDGVDEKGVPLANVVVEHIHEHCNLARGAASLIGAACAIYGLSPQQVAEQIATGKLTIGKETHAALSRGEDIAVDLAQHAVTKIVERREERREMIARLGEGEWPLIYLIVATGNIYEDVTQAQAAAEAGADIIAVIRSTAQSLLDYVPYGATTEGYGGTYATQENFRIMRAALDEVGEKIGRYIRLVNYCSGLCMPEIAAMGAMERLDMMLNDAMYGILFRDINMQRTFVDQHFSRMINGFAGIIINTGEDNYLTTADAYEAAHTVLASNLINEQLALSAGLRSEQLGLGHAFQLNPDMKDGLLYEIAQAEMTRQIFPDAPLKYMPPTKYMSGNIFKGYLMDHMFNLVGVLTGQGIQLLGVPVEAIHTPFMHDRWLAIDSAKYAFNHARHLRDEISYRSGGKIDQRAQSVLKQTVDLLEKIEKIGLTKAIEEGIFADIKRRRDGGRGKIGVIERSEDYFNPFFSLLKVSSEED
jgi:beta-lysine 5,6-aminomutase alpha subunit